MMQFGIWKFETDTGLIGTPENLPEHYLGVDHLWETEQTVQGEVWKWPIHFARNTWCTPQIADDFNKAFFYAQTYFENKRPGHFAGSLDMDQRTIQHQIELLADHLYGSEDEIII
jgi:hypothetical protein